MTEEYFQQIKRTLQDPVILKEEFAGWQILKRVMQQQKFLDLLRQKDGN